MKNIGFIGLGAMGKPMAMNVLKRGYTLTVYNRSGHKAEELAQLGAEIAGTPGEAARSADVLITVVSDDEALKEVYYGVGGVMGALHPGLTCIDCSTVSPELSRRLYQDLSSHFIDFLDAPVTGGTIGASSGTLVFMAGGSQEAFEENLELFQAMGSQAVYMGPAGSGSSAKLAHNTMVGIQAAALCEGLALAAKSGLNPERFLEIVAAGGAQSRFADSRGKSMLQDNYESRFALDLMLKDLKLSAETANGLGVASPLLHVALSIYQMAGGSGWGELDASAIMKSYESWSGVKLAQALAEHPAALEAAAGAERERRRSVRIPMSIRLKLSVYQWEQEGSFSGQAIDGTLVDLSETGLLITSSTPLAMDMFIVIHFPQESNLPPITGRIIRVVSKEEEFQYGCMLSGLPLVTRLQLEEYIRQHRSNMTQ